MGIGAAVFLIVVGAILAFALRDTSLAGVIDLQVVGWVLILAGIAGLIFTAVLVGRRRRTVVERRVTPAYDRPAATYERRTVERPVGYEHRVVDEGPDVV